MGILARYVRLYEEHKIVYVVSGLEEQATHGRVRYPLIYECRRAHMQLYHLGNVLHRGIEGQLESPKHLGHHFGPNIVVVVEGPAQRSIETLRLRLCHIVQKGCPAEVEIIALCSEVVYHLIGVCKIIFMANAISGLGAFEG